MTNMACSSDAPVPIPTKLMNLMHGFCASQALFAACELGIFQTIHASGKPLSAKQLSEKMSTHPNATERLLNALVNFELLHKQTGNSNDEEVVYENTEVAKWLTLDWKYGNLIAFAKFAKQTSYGLFGNLAHAIRENQSQWRRTFNETSEELFKCVYSSQEKTIGFMETMVGIGKPGAPFFVSAFDLSRFKTMCDIGGRSLESQLRVHIIFTPSN